MDGPIKKQNTYEFAVMIESIYHLRKRNLVLPFSFLLNIIQTFITGSKLVLTNNGMLPGGAKDTTYQTWLNANAVDPRKTPLDDLWANISSKATKENINELIRLQL